MSIASELEKLRHDAVIELFIVDLSKFGGGLERFHAGTNELNEPVVWQGKTYEPRPVIMEGFQTQGGERPRPTMTIGNVNGAISDLVVDYEQMVGAWVHRIRTLAMFLDPANFKNGNPQASNQELPRDIFRIARRSSETDVQVEFELGAPDDVMNRKIPSQQIVVGCPAIYTDVETGCDWVPGTGGRYFDKYNNPSNAANDMCSKTLTGCRLRFQDQPLAYMGTPAADLVQS